MGNMKNAINDDKFRKQGEEKFCALQASSRPHHRVEWHRARVKFCQCITWKKYHGFDGNNNFTNSATVCYNLWEASTHLICALVNHLE